MEVHKGKTVTLLGYHITHKPVRTVKGQTMSFGTFLDPNKDWIDTVHFPDIHAFASAGRRIFPYHRKGRGGIRGV